MRKPVHGYIARELKKQVSFKVNVDLFMRVDTSHVIAAFWDMLKTKEGEKSWRAAKAMDVYER